MHYISTRGHASTLDFKGVLLSGLASDGGLYVPQYWPVLTENEFRHLRGLAYPDLAVRILEPFVGNQIPSAILHTLAKEAYGCFDHQAVIPLVQIDQSLWLLELFHGPTLAFKDLALQLVSRLFDHVLSGNDKPVTLITATSGDTGPAVIEAFRDRKVEIVVLYPKDRISPLQRRQMTTVLSPNVHVLAVDASFDDCQALVKAAFNDEALRRECRLATANSINWARIVCQMVYYIAAGVALGAPDRKVGFVVPTGNFGNIYAGYGAYRMGLPIDRLIIASNENDTLPRFFHTGLLEPQKVVSTISPSIDIALSSNFERFLFELCGRDSSALAKDMEMLKKDGKMSVSDDKRDQACQLFKAYRVDQENVRQTITQIVTQTQMLIDPHTAVGIAGAYSEYAHDQTQRSTLIALACAHPAKFPETVTTATGITPNLPTWLRDIYQRPERITVCDNDEAALGTYLRQLIA